MAIVGFLCLFMPGILSYTVFTVLMKNHRLFRAVLIVLTTILLGIVSGFVFEPFYAQLHGTSPSNDMTYHMAFIMGVLQVPIGVVIAMFSLLPARSKQGMGVPSQSK